MNYKQVIIVRKDLNMRKGKMIAQGCHASLMAYERTYQNDRQLWAESNHTKIVVGVDSEAELHEIYNKAKQEEGLACAIVLDAGKTEFKEPTYTAVAIGPDDESLIDPITRSLKLL